ncbi:MAG: RsmB/NOP family class I SAM-dependent RNA methyltransferase [Eubacteriales bacterium]|jgi:NOL1/NOP2/sun family putative RNA methylase|nr:RsmB/NOP family class I SAM-dependent RNA methyltransferase [Eubacteriales bacterium]
MQNLPEAYLTRMRAQLGETEFAAYLAAMEEKPARALRVNLLKTTAADFVAQTDVSLTPTGILPESFFFKDDVAIGRQPLHAAGLCYVQEPAAQAPAALTQAGAGMTVLDLCAAPGGKTTQLAAMMQNTGLLVANEPVRSRAEILAGNIERLGVSNALVTCMRPDALASALGACFDVVLVDAPCSGEGMFRKDETAIREWSREHVLACAARQEQILQSASLLLKPEGRLVYSTCTFSREENEGAIERFLSAHQDFVLIESRRMYPHSSVGEGQFMAVLVRAGEGEANFAAPYAPSAVAPVALVAPAGERIPAFEAFWRETFVIDLPTAMLLPDGRVLLSPALLPRELKSLHIVRAGVLAGELKNGRFTPDHALAMAYPANAFRATVPLEVEALSRFLAGETVACNPALSGWCPATVLGHPVGWGKAVDGVLKNHIPKGLRIR